MLTFNHSGKIGDILYSLYFCKELSKKHKFDKFNFNIQTNVFEENPYEHTNVRLSTNSALFIKELIESQEYINDLTINDNIPISNELVNLDMFRKFPLNTMAGNIPNYYYNLVNFHLDRNFDKPIITVQNKNEISNNKIILSYTERYNNICTDMNALKDFKDYIIFVGTEKEYLIFKNRYFDVSYYKLKSMLDLAELMNNCRCFIGNQSGNFALAECMKVPRILLSAEIIKMNNRNCFGPINVICSGGWNDIAITNEKMYQLIKDFIK